MVFFVSRNFISRAQFRPRPIVLFDYAIIAEESRVFLKFEGILPAVARQRRGSCSAVKVRPYPREISNGAVALEIVYDYYA